MSTDGALEGLVEAAGLGPERVIDTLTPYAFPDVPTAVRGLRRSGAWSLGAVTSCGSGTGARLGVPSFA